MNIDNKIGDRKLFDNILKSKSGRYFVSFVNPFSYNSLMKNKTLSENIDVFFIDGNLFRLLYGLFHNKVERISFDYSSIASDVLDYAVSEGLNVGFVGATETELEKAIDNINLNHNNLKVVYKRNGYFSSQEEREKALHCINDTNVQLLIVGMGTPYQEEFMSLVKKSCTKVRLAFSCGGFLTQTSINKDYYHPLIKKFHLMWLQRMFMHSHVRKRVLTDYPVFVVKYIITNLKRVFRVRS